MLRLKKLSEGRGTIRARDIVAGNIAASPQAFQVSIEPTHKTGRFSCGSVAMFIVTLTFRMIFREHLFATRKTTGLVQHNLGKVE